VATYLTKLASELPEQASRSLSLWTCIDQQTPGVVGIIHVISDNVSIHKGKLVSQWLDSHPRFVMHHDWLPSR
jgi:hypothetical protein